MENIINLFFLILFVILVYNYSLYYFKYHKDKTKQYISYDTTFNKGGNNRKNNSGNNRKNNRKNKSGDNSGNNRKNKSGNSIDEKDKSKLNDNCDHDKCKNNSECISTDTGYYCQCVPTSGIDPDGTPFTGRTFSGRHCEFQNDQSLGVNVEFDIGQMKPQVVFERKPLFNTENFQFNDFI